MGKAEVHNSEKLSLEKIYFALEASINSYTRR